MIEFAYISALILSLCLLNLHTRVTRLEARTSRYFNNNNKNNRGVHNEHK